MKAFRRVRGRGGGGGGGSIHPLPPTTKLQRKGSGHFTLTLTSLLGTSRWQHTVHKVSFGLWGAALFSEPPQHNAWSSFMETARDCLQMEFAVPRRGSNEISRKSELRAPEQRCMQASCLDMIQLRNAARKLTKFRLKHLIFRGALFWTALHYTPEDLEE